MGGDRQEVNLSKVFRLHFILLTQMHEDLLILKSPGVTSLDEIKCVIKDFRIRIRSTLSIHEGKLRFSAQSNQDQTNITWRQNRIADGSANFRTFCKKRLKPSIVLLEPPGILPEASSSIMLFFTDASAISMEACRSLDDEELFLASGRIFLQAFWHDGSSLGRPCARYGQRRGPFVQDLGSVSRPTGVCRVPAGGERGSIRTS
ncbi:uncharacterized protein LOC133648149 [Entelurus aequoreus]|uniref:uncharacterized protein LOC133648149 n=1 Tax=Entelurus aequoreus TaxID=161455 RepID=UPI002B1E68C2|nr:uncharacterized protein LOC133648149 [Entelurus aequoreus]